MMVFPRLAVIGQDRRFDHVYRVEIKKRNEMYEILGEQCEILHLTLFNEDGTILNVDNVIDVEIL